VHSCEEALEAVVGAQVELHWHEAAPQVVHPMRILLAVEELVYLVGVAEVVEDQPTLPEADGLDEVVVDEDM